MRRTSENCLGMKKKKWQFIYSAIVTYKCRKQFQDFTRTCVEYYNFMKHTHSMMQGVCIYGGVFHRKKKLTLKNVGDTGSVSAIFINIHKNVFCKSRNRIIEGYFWKHQMEIWTRHNHFNHSSIGITESEIKVRQNAVQASGRLESLLTQQIASL